MTGAGGLWLDDISSSGEVRHTAVALVALQGVPAPVSQQLKNATNNFNELTQMFAHSCDRVE